MTQFINLAASEGGVVGDIAENFGVNWQLFISQLIAFTIVGTAVDLEQQLKN